MRACSYAVVRTRRHGSTVGTALAEDGSARGPFRRLACGHARMPSCEHGGTTSTVGAGEGTAVEGTIPATAGVRACSYALVRTRGATAHSALGADSGRGSLWLRRGEGEGALCAGPEARLSALVRLKVLDLGARRTFSDATAVREVPTFGPVQRGTRRGHLRAITAYTARITFGRAYVYRT